MVLLTLMKRQGLLPYPVRSKASSSALILPQTPSPKRYEKRYERPDLSDFQNGDQIRLLTRKTTRVEIFGERIPQWSPQAFMTNYLTGLALIWSSLHLLVRGV